MGVEDIANGGLEVAKNLIPPVDGGWRRLRYDITVSLVLLIGGSLVIIHILWVCGWLTIFGIAEPFAYAGDVNQLQYRVVRVQADSIESKIQDAKTKVCLAINAKNQTALDAWARVLEGLKQEFRDQIGREPNVMGCDELLITGSSQP